MCQLTSLYCLKLPYWHCHLFHNLDLLHFLCLFFGSNVNETINKIANNKEIKKLSIECCRKLQSDRNTIHKNLVLCLFVAELVFFCGIVPQPCSPVSTCNCFVITSVFINLIDLYSPIEILTNFGHYFEIIVGDVDSSRLDKN